MAPAISSAPQSLRGRTVETETDWGVDPLPPHRTVCVVFSSVYYRGFGPRKSSQIWGRGSEAYQLGPYLRAQRRSERGKNSLLRKGAEYRLAPFSAQGGGNAGTTRDELLRLKRGRFSQRGRDLQLEIFGRTRGQPPSFKHRRPPYQPAYAPNRRYSGNCKRNLAARPPGARRPRRGVRPSGVSRSRDRAEAALKK